MPAILNSQEILDNIIVLTQPFRKKETIDLADLKSHYLLFLKKIQPYCPLMISDNLFYASADVEQTFCDFFQQDSRIMSEGIHYLPENPLYPSPTERMNALSNGFEEIQKYDPIFYKLFKLIMNTVFCTVSSRIGGTSVNPSFIGVMCAYLDMTANTISMPELFIHEFTHNVLFLDNLRYKHYTAKSLLDDKTLFLMTNDRGPVPFERWFHALVVYAEIISARNRYIGHEIQPSQHASTPFLIKRALREINYVEKHPAIQESMTYRSQLIFKRCLVFFKEQAKFHGTFVSH